MIRDADRKSVQEIAAVRADLVGRARDGKLPLPDLEGGTFTISNLGMFGVEQFVAVLNPPQVAILAVGSIEDRPLVVDGEIDRRADDDDDAHLRPPRDRRSRRRRVPADAHGARRDAVAGALGAERMVVRRGGAQDVRFLRDMLHHAYYWSEREPDEGPGPVALYVKGWGRPGDTALIAIDDGFPVGAAWYRLFRRDHPGYGFVDEADAGACDRGRAEPARSRSRRSLLDGPGRTGASRRVRRAQPQRAERERAAPRPSTRSTGSSASTRTAATSMTMQRSV